MANTEDISVLRVVWAKVPVIDGQWWWVLRCRKFCHRMDGIGRMGGLFRSVPRNDNEKRNNKSSLYFYQFPCPGRIKQILLNEYPEMTCLIWYKTYLWVSAARQPVHPPSIRKT